MASFNVPILVVTALQMAENGMVLVNRSELVGALQAARASDAVTKDEALKSATIAAGSLAHTAELKLRRSSSPEGYFGL